LRPEFLRLDVNSHVQSYPTLRQSASLRRRMPSLPTNTTNLRLLSTHVDTPSPTKMAANTRYQPVPVQDSYHDEEANYTQAPPSYQQEQEPVPGEARTEDDNVPDDFKFGGSVAEATLPVRMMFVRKVYSILTVQLIFTTVLSAVSFFSDSYRKWIQANQWMMWVSLFGAIGFMLLTFWKRKSYPTNLIFLAGFTGLEAYAISVITSFYESKIVLQALIFTMGIFLALTLFACQTKYDFTSWMPYLFGGLWVLILFGFMAAFFPYNSKVELGYGIVAALIFSGYILVDTQLVMRHYHVEEEIAAAISLYLDVINLFLAILRILNSQQNN
jgi:hypothetical protein